MDLASKYRAYVFTWNNYTEEDEEYIQTKIKDTARYLLYGKETAPSTGTPHLQGYVYFHNAKHQKSVARLFRKNWVKPARGTADDSYVYCRKEGTYYYEHGDKPMAKEQRNKKGGEGQKARWANAAQKGKEGRLGELEEEDPQIYILHGNRLASLYEPNTSTIDGTLEHEWWVGPTGSGKSRLLWELYPDHFPKALNKWWDGYKYQEIVAIEEWSPKNDCTASALKRWADRYTFSGEMKGGTLHKLRPKKIIVLSNYTPQQCFLNSEDLEPILRRFTVIHFPHEEQHARFRAEDGSDSSTEVSLLETPMGEELPDLSLDGDFWGDQ